MTRHFLVILVALFAVKGAAQQSTDQIAQNGGFENGIGYPTAQDQLDGYCSHWIRGSTANTPDWYTTQTLPGALRGACNFENGDNQTVFNAMPKIETHDNSLFYGGFGSTENMRNELSRRTYPNSVVKISFWFSPRGVERDTRIGVLLVDTDDSQHNNIIVYLDCTPNAGFPPCEWYYFESDWLPTGQYTFDQVQIGGLAPPNFAGAFNEKGYIYVDDVKVYNGLDCCPPFMRYENTDDLTAQTHVIDYIEAGFDAGIPNMAGDVIVRNGQSILFQAENTVQLNAGFFVEPGANFTAAIDDCNPFTESSGSQVVIALSPNVLTPNGDGINDELCFLVSGAYYFKVEIFSRWGTRNETLIYQHSGFNTSNHFCVWNGGNYGDGTYYYIATFSNCTESERTEGFFTLIRGNGRMAAAPVPEQTDGIYVWPNPANDVLNVQVKNDQYTQVELVNALGGIVIGQAFSQDEQISLNVSGFEPGYYTLRLSGPDTVYCTHVILGGN